MVHVVARHRDAEVVLLGAVVFSGNGWRHWSHEEAERNERKWNEADTQDVENQHVRDLPCALDVTVIVV